MFFALTSFHPPSTFLQSSSPYNFIPKPSQMHIQKKTVLKWPTQQSLPLKPLKPNPHRSKGHQKSQSIGAIFGLPATILEQPNLKALRMMIKAKSKSYRNYLEDSQINNEGNVLKKRLMSRTKEMFEPIKKHNSVMETIRIDQSQLDGIKEIKNKKAPIASEHSSQKTLNILQKIIFKEVDFYAKEKPVIVIKASKLPIIQNKESKRKQTLAAYEGRFLPESISTIKYEIPAVKPPAPSKVVRKKGKQEPPYFSGWEISQGNDF